MLVYVFLRFGRGFRVDNMASIGEGLCSLWSSTWCGRVERRVEMSEISSNYESIYMMLRDEI
jgi:hypothetical protein